MIENKPVRNVDEFGLISWKLNGQYHREDGPALEYPSGSKAWLRYGEFHRDDGPAIERPREEFPYLADYYINGKHIPQLSGKLIYGKENLAKYLLLL